MNQAAAVSDAIDPPSRIARLCRLLGCRYPVIQGGMTSVGTAELAAAVSEAGGFGLVTAGRMTPDEFQAELRRALTLTRRPIGVNIPITRDPDWMRATIAVTVAEPIRAVFTGGGNPAPWIEPVVKAGLTLAIVVSHPEQALKAQQLGASLVVAEGMESGGKTSRDEISTLALVPAVADAVSIPVVAAGGIIDGRGAAAAICLGASGVQMGTRFLLSCESPVHPDSKQTLISASLGQTVVIGRAHKMGRRVFHNPAAAEVARREYGVDIDEMLKLVAGDRSVRGLLHGDLSSGMMACGQGIGAIHAVLPAAEIVAEIIDGMRQAGVALMAETRTLAERTTSPDA